MAECEVPLAITYGEVTLDAGYRLDMLVENLVVIENKVVETLLPVHSAQLLTYLKKTKHRVGLLINFNRSKIKNGIHRIVL